MSDVPAVKVTNNHITSWANKARNAISRNTIAHSPDLLFKETSAGTSLILNPKHKYVLGGVDYSSSFFDISESYNAKTIKRVNDTSHGAVPGTYISNQNIPSLYYYGALVSAGISTSGSDYSIYVRDPAVSYVPGSGSNNAWDLFSSGTGISVVDWDYNAAQTKGNFIRVDPNKSYPISFDDNGSFPPLMAGIWEVVADVPSSGSANRTGNLPYPFYPIWDDSAKVTVSG